MSNCGIVKDLLPLYADDVCSIESKKLVHDHLEECEECRKELKSYEFGVVTNDMDEKKAAEKFKKKVQWKAVKKAIAIMLILATIVFGAMNAAWYVIEKRPFDKYTLIYNEFYPHELLFEKSTEFLSYIEKDNSEGIDIGDFERVSFKVHEPSYLRYNGAIYFYDDKDCNKELSMTVCVYPDKTGGFDFMVDLMYQTEEIDIWEGFHIDEDMNLVLTDVEEYAKKNYKYKKYDNDGNELKTKEEKIAYAKNYIESENAKNEQFYAEYYEQVKTMMSVIYEVMGLNK